MQAFVLLIIFLRVFIGNSTSAIASITSAVPAALVIALEDVFGIVSPAAAQIETMIGVVLFPGTPPIECLSTINFFLNFILFAVLKIALIK